MDDILLGLIDVLLGDIIPERPHAMLITGMVGGRESSSPVRSVCHLPLRWIGLPLGVRASSGRAARRSVLAGKDDKLVLMACYLRVSGRRLDVDAYLRRPSALQPVKVHRRGQPEFPDSRPKGRKLTRSNLNVKVSAQPFERFAAQMRDAERYLRLHARSIRALRRFPGVEDATLDFGIARRDDVVVRYLCFSEQLVALAGRLGLALELSLYPIDQRPRRRRA